MTAQKLSYTWARTAVTADFNGTKKAGNTEGTRIFDTVSTMPLPIHIAHSILGIAIAIHSVITVHIDKIFLLFKWFFLAKT